MSMTVKEVQSEILRLKKEKDICILAHSYQAREILEIADFTGDSYALSKMAAKTESSTVLMCGVRFMAETVKILSPEKKVILSSPIAACPMAEQFEKDDILQLKEMFPDYAVVAYINTTAALKTVCDVCVTSSSAVEIVSKLDSKNILFIPDCNLGAFVAKQCPDKTSSCCRADVLFMRRYLCAMSKKQRRCTPVRCCSFIPNVFPRLPKAPTISALPAAS